MAKSRSSGEICVRQASSVLDRVPGVEILRADKAQPAISSKDQSHPERVTRRWEKTVRHHTPLYA